MIYLVAIISHLQSDFPNLLKFWVENDYCLIPIPLHPYRQNWRGFNQSEIIADTVAAKINLTSSTSYFSRTVYSSPLAKIRLKSERLNHLGRVFTLNNQLKLPQNLIIFDDVFTTGSTVKSLSSTIPGNKSVWILTIAG